MKSPHFHYHGEKENGPKISFQTGFYILRVNEKSMEKIKMAK